MVADEEDVAGEEDDVVEKIHEEIGDAEFEDRVLEVRVNGGEAAA